MIATVLIVLILGVAHITPVSPPYDTASEVASPQVTPHAEPYLALPAPSYEEAEEEDRSTTTLDKNAFEERERLLRKYHAARTEAADVAMSASAGLTRKPPRKS